MINNKCHQNVNFSLEFIFHVSNQNLLRRQEESENGIAWSISSESSDDLSSPRLSVGGLCNSTNHKVTCYG